MLSMSVSVTSHVLVGLQVSHTFYLHLKNRTVLNEMFKALKRFRIALSNLLTNVLLHTSKTFTALLYSYSEEIRHNWTLFTKYMSAADEMLQLFLFCYKSKINTNAYRILQICWCRLSVIWDKWKAAGLILFFFLDVLIHVPKDFFSSENLINLFGREPNGLQNNKRSPLAFYLSI